MRKGFTLIELLVVIAIIAILAAILFPVFARAKAKAKQNNCLSNVKELQLAMLMYVSDWNQTYPIDGTCCGSSTSYWPNFIFQYVKNVQLFICPSDTVVGGCINLGLPAQSPDMISYGRNSYLTGGGNASNPAANVADTEPIIQYPAEMLGIMDAVQFTIPTLYATMWTSGKTTFATTLAAITSDSTANTARHNLGCNMSYLDGHAKWIAFANIPDPTQPTGTTFNGITNRHFWYGID
jgi:prepilin-type N-terminal cleavage/methylation domain-containing protein/prepilin-type processing-associated H-X9-DG protein